MGNETNGGVGDTTITPMPDETKQAASYSYPGLKTGADGTDIQPKTGSPVNNKRMR